MLCYTFFLVQPNFKKQKCKIKESIINTANKKHYIVIYYPHTIVNLIILSTFGIVLKSVQKKIVNKF